MHPIMIKVKYGFTLDKSNPCDEPCPRCGRVVCHVKEDPHKVFCSYSFCDFQDYYNDNAYNPIIERVEYFLNYPPVFLYNVGYEYSQYNHPFMSIEDIKEGNLIIREFELDEIEYNKPTTKWAGVDKEHCYKKNCKIIAKYSNVRLMVNDGWRIEENPNL